MIKLRDIKYYKKTLLNRIEKFAISPNTKSIKIKNIQFSKFTIYFKIY